MLDFTRPWAIRSKQNLVNVIERIKAEGDGKNHEPSEPSTSPDGTRIIPIRGVLFRYHNWLCDYGYGTSYDWIYNQMDAAVNDQTIKDILFVIDSPGGETNGLTELCDYIAKCSKPIHSYASGTCASAAYWIACATKSITAIRAAYIGCIGTIAVYYDDKKMMEAYGIEELVFVSSQSPDKYADPTTEHGAAIIQKHVNENAQIFVDFVAEMRSVSVDDVIANFGKGDVLIAKEAVAVGMIDAIGNFQESLLRIYKSRNQVAGENMSLGQTSLSLQNQDEPEEELPEAEPEATGDVVEEETNTEEEKQATAFITKNPKAASIILQMGANKERERIKGIEEAAELHPHNKALISKAKFESNMSAGDFLLESMRSSKQNAKTKIEQLNADGGEVPSLDNRSNGKPSAENRLEQAALEHAKSMAPGAKK